MKMPKCDGLVLGDIVDNWNTVMRVLLGVQTTVMLVGWIFVYPVNMSKTKPAFLTVCWALLSLGYFFFCFCSLISQILDQDDRDLFGSASEWFRASMEFSLVGGVLMMVMHQVLTMEIFQAAQELPLVSRPAEDKAGVESARNCQYWTRLAINVFYYMTVFVYFLLNSITRYQEHRVMINPLALEIFWYWPQVFSGVLMLVSLFKLKSAIAYSGTQQPNGLVFMVCGAVQIMRLFFLCLAFALSVTQIYSSELDYCKMFKAIEWMYLFLGIASILCIVAFTFVSFRMIGDIPNYNEERITKGCMHVVKGFSQAGQPVQMTYNHGQVAQPNVVYQQPGAYAKQNVDNENEAMLQGSVNA